MNQKIDEIIDYIQLLDESALDQVIHFVLGIIPVN